MKQHILFALILSGILISIDFIVNLFFHNFYIQSSRFTLSQIETTFAIALLISFTTKIFRNIFSIIFILFSSIEVIYFSFFRGLVQPYQFEVVSSEIEDIIDSMYSILPTFGIVSIFFIFFVWIIIKLSTKIKKGYKVINYIFSIFLIFLPLYAYFRPYFFTISPFNFSYINMLYASSLATKTMLSPIKIAKFEPYKIKKVDNQEQNIIVIMGESLSYKRMHLFGWDNNNTPNLDRLKDNPKFFYTKAISCGVNTPVSVVSFFTLKREPTNMSILLKQETNILRLANENGYNTRWLSMQNEGMSISSILEYASIIKLKKDYPKNSFDDRLLSDLKQIDWSQKNFIVLHFRANHSPYEKYIPLKFQTSKYNRFDYHKYKIDSYNDSIVYVDYLLDKIFRYMKSTKSNFKLYFTSDHAERLGYKDDHYKYGHSQLDFEVTKVPFLIYSNRDIILDKNLTNHYKIGKIILNDLGYKLENPNDNGIDYFINGLNRYGKSGYLKYTFDDFVQ